MDTHVRLSSLEKSIGWNVVSAGFFRRVSRGWAVDRVESSGLSAGPVAAELRLHETVLRRRITQFGQQAAENARLRRDNEWLRMERDILGVQSRNLMVHHRA